MTKILIIHSQVKVKSVEDVFARIPSVDKALRFKTWGFLTVLPQNLKCTIVEAPTSDPVAVLLGPSHGRRSILREMATGPDCCVWTDNLEMARGLATVCADEGTEVQLIAA